MSFQFGVLMIRPVTAVRSGEEGDRGGERFQEQRGSREERSAQRGGDGQSSLYSWILEAAAPNTGSLCRSVERQRESYVAVDHMTSL